MMQPIASDLPLQSPWLNAAGSLGFSPPANGWNWDEPLGAFVTNPISLRPRRPAEERCLRSYPGGFLLHTGWPNPGLRAVLRHYAQRWAASRRPVWVHLLSEQPSEVNEMVRSLEGLEGVMAVELGLPPHAEASLLLALVEAARGELPLLVSLPLDAVREPWVERLPGLGVSAITLSAPRGSLTGPKARLVSGRLYGPALLPQVFDALQRLQPLGLPLIAGCAVFSKETGDSLLSAGAAAVQLDAVLWKIT